MQPLNALLVSALAASLLAQTIAAKTKFITPSGVGPGMRLIVMCFLVCGTVQTMILWRAPLTRYGTIFGLLLYFAALALFFAACDANRARRLSIAYSEDLPDHLVSWGPYRYVRHPFYASYCLTWVAGAAACGSAVVVSTFVLMLAMYVRAARFEERKFLRSPQAADYANYQRSTGMLVPRSELLVKLVSRSAKTPPHIFPK